MTTETKMVPEEEARKAIQDMSRRVALLHMCYARALVDALGEERGKELIKKAIWDYGTIVGKRSRERVRELGLEPTLANMGRGNDLSPLGFDHRRVVVDGEARSQSHGCVLAEIWDEYGENELGGLYCLVDPSKMQAYDAHYTMIHCKKMPDGDEYCEIAIRPVKGSND